mmetsp:Transcript_10414/g.30648  ORF Transcript_10414/g.30648 Transcript_10414/m.30648 type:complete len:205 (-) Transcript_10414:1312-1926(-)
MGSLMSILRPRDRSATSVSKVRRSLVRFASSSATFASSVSFAFSAASARRRSAAISAPHARSASPRPSSSIISRCTASCLAARSSASRLTLGSPSSSPCDARWTRGVAASHSVVAASCGPGVNPRDNNEGVCDRAVADVRAVAGGCDRASTLTRAAHVPICEPDRWCTATVDGTPASPVGDDGTSSTQKPTCAGVRSPRSPSPA